MRNVFPHHVRNRLLHRVRNILRTGCGATSCTQCGAPFCNAFKTTLPHRMPRLPSHHMKNPFGT
eukprot:9560097-Karenia_brevis.AAC.1